MTMGDEVKQSRKRTRKRNKSPSGSHKILKLSAGRGHLKDRSAHVESIECLSEEMKPSVSKTESMRAKSSLINRIWGNYYSDCIPVDLNVKGNYEKPNAEAEEESAEGVKESKCLSSSTLRKLCFPSKDIKWDSEASSRTHLGEPVYKSVILHGDKISCGDYVLVEREKSEKHPSVHLIEYMYQKDARKLAHGRLMARGLETVLGNAGNERELFLTNNCSYFELSHIIQRVTVRIQSRSWGHQYRRSYAFEDGIEREIAEYRMRQGLPMEYFCKSLYCPNKGGFFRLPPIGTIGLGTGVCQSCVMKEVQRDEKAFKINTSMTCFMLRGTEYNINDFLHVGPQHFASYYTNKKTFKGGRNVGLKPFVVCQLLKIEAMGPEVFDCKLLKVRVRRFFRPEDLSVEISYQSDIHEVYYSDSIVTVPLLAIEGKCEVRRKSDFPTTECNAQHVFFCELFYDPIIKGLQPLSADIPLSPFKERDEDDTTMRNEEEVVKSSTHRLATLDIFAGCGGLSEGLQKSGVSLTKWAIELEEAAGEAFRANHPDAVVVLNDCNVILRAIMARGGDAEDCIATSDTVKLADELDHKDISKLPRPGEVDFIHGGPPCQGFSSMNRHNHSTSSKSQCEMVLCFLSFADYFRPKYFLLENVRNFVTYNKGQAFKLTLASLLEMGYQVRFGVLEAGAYGVSQSRRRAFIWAASPDEILPEWPEPVHVFSSLGLEIKLSKNEKYAAVRSTKSGAPFRAITVRDTIGDLPAVRNGASATTMEYEKGPVSWFQKNIRGETPNLTDHISKEMSEGCLIRCKKIPKRPGADWRNLSDEKVRLSNGKFFNLLPRFLPSTAERHNKWKGVLGRLDWVGNFPTCLTDPQPTGKVGMCFHPDQDRILTVREYARSQGFPDSYVFSGDIREKHRQVGNAVPPPLAFALGRKLKEAVERKRRSMSC